VSDPADLVDLRFDAPFFVKPVAEGTGKGCSSKSIVRSRAELPQVCADLVARFSQPALVEPYLSGREFTIGVTGTGRTARTVATMEVMLLAKAETGVYSYSNKSQYEDRVEYRLSDAQSDPVVAAAERVALDAWRVLGCRDGGRVDIRCDGLQRPQFMEVNPLAGLNPEHSDLPILARMAGIDFRTLIGRIMTAATTRIKGGPA
jgi:D-alanine-D-alanine ligase